MVRAMRVLFSLASPSGLRPQAADEGKVHHNIPSTGNSAALQKPLRPRRLGQLPCEGRLFARALPAGKPPLTGEVVKRSDDRRGFARSPQ